MSRGKEARGFRWQDLRSFGAGFPRLPCMISAEKSLRPACLPVLWASAEAIYGRKHVSSITSLSCLKSRPVEFSNHTHAFMNLIINMAMILVKME